MSRTCSIEQNGMEGIQNELVRFDNVKACYHLDATRLNLTYTLSDALASTHQDWIGLFQTNWTDILEPLAFTSTSNKSKSRKKKKNKTKDEDRRQVNFPLDNLVNVSKQGHQQYQFVYVSKSGRVLGASRAFTIQGEELWNIEDDDNLSRLSSLPRNSSPLDDSEISIISRGNAGLSESPVILSYPSDVEVDWEIPNLSDAKDKEESPLSEFSDIEILSTSPSKDDAGRYTNIPQIPENDFNIVDDVSESPSKNEVTICDNVELKNGGGSSSMTRSQRKRARKNKRKELVGNNFIGDEEDKKESVNQTAITESLVEKLTFVDLGESSSNAENDNLSDVGEVQSRDVCSKRGKKKRKKERARQLITELSPEICCIPLIAAESPEISVSGRGSENKIGKVEEVLVSKKNKKGKKNCVDKVTKVCDKSSMDSILSHNSESEKNITSRSNVSSRKVSQKYDDAVFSGNSSPPVSLKLVNNKEQLKNNDYRNETSKGAKKANVNNETVCPESNSEHIRPMQNLDNRSIDLVNNIEKSKESKKSKKSKAAKNNYELKQIADVSNVTELANDTLCNFSVDKEHDLETIKKEKKNEDNKKIKSKNADATDEKRDSYRNSICEEPKKRQKSDLEEIQAITGMMQKNIEFDEGSDYVSAKSGKGSSKKNDVIRSVRKTGPEVKCDQQDTVSVVVKTNVAGNSGESKVDSKKQRKEKKQNYFEKLRKQIEFDNTEKEMENENLVSECSKHETGVFKLNKLELKGKGNNPKVTNEIKVQNSRTEQKQVEKISNSTCQRKVQINAFSGSRPLITVTTSIDSITNASLTIAPIIEVEESKIEKSQGVLMVAEKKSRKKRKLENTSTPSTFAMASESGKKMISLPPKEITVSEMFSNDNEVNMIHNAEDQILERPSPLLEKELRTKEYRKKCTVVANTAKRVKNKAALKTSSMKERRTKMSTERDLWRKNILEINSEESEKDEVEEEGQDNEKQEDNVQTLTKSTKLTSSPPNDVTNFPPLDKPITVKELFAEEAKDKGQRASNGNKAEISFKFKSTKLGNVSPFMIKAANTGKLTKARPVDKSNKRSTSATTSPTRSPFQVCLLDIMDAVPEDPAAFDFIQWQKEKALGKVKNHELVASDANKTFCVADKVANLKKMKLEMDNITSSGLVSENHTIAENRSAKLMKVFGGDASVDMLTSYANVLKRCKNSSNEENDEVVKTIETNHKNKLGKTSNVKYQLPTSSKTQSKQKKHGIRARGVLFPGLKNIDPSSAIDTQCYLLDKFDKSKSSLSSSRPKYRMANRLKTLKEKQKKLRQIRLQNRRLKEVRNACILTNTSLSIQGASCSKLFENDVKTNQTQQNMQIIKWPMPEHFREETTVDQVADRAALMNTGPANGDEQSKRAVVIFGDTNCFEEYKQNQEEYGGRSRYQVIEEMNNDDDVNDNDKENTMLGQFEWSGLESMPSTSWAYPDTLREGLQKTKTSAKGDSKGSSPRKAQYGDTSPEPSRPSKHWKARHARLFAGLPSSLGVAHHVIEKLRSEVTSKENLVDGLHNEVNSLKEVIKKQVKHEVKARCKLIAVKRKYKSMRLSESSRRDSALTSKRSRRHTNGDTSDEEERPANQPTCKRKRLQPATSTREEATTQPANMLTEMQDPCVRDERDVKDYDGSINLYPNLQEELLNLQKEVGCVPTSATQNVFSNEFASNEKEEKLLDNRQQWSEKLVQVPIFAAPKPQPPFFIANRQPTENSNFERCCFDQRQKQLSEGSCKAWRQPHMDVNQATHRTAPQQTRMFQTASDYASSVNQVLPTQREHSHRQRNAPSSWGYGYDQLNFSPPRPSLLPTPIFSFPPPLIEHNIQTTPPTLPVKNPAFFANPSGRPFYRRSSPPWKDQSPQRYYRGDSVSRNGWPLAPNNCVLNCQCSGNPGQVYERIDRGFKPQQVDTNRHYSRGAARARPQREVANNMPQNVCYAYNPNNSIPFYQPSQNVGVYQNSSLIPSPVQYANYVQDLNSYYDGPCQYTFDSFHS